jgi:hypothetical protein
MCFRKYASKLANSKLVFDQTDLDPFTIKRIFGNGGFTGRILKLEIGG